ncbi:MAG: hypothetical protein JNL22_02655 [Bacteroidales bacterium]|nr:hypothetical protein [Bacteroidales bacterium]
MKTKFMLTISLCAILLSLLSCDKKNDENVEDGDYKLNKIVATMDGRDTIIDIAEIYITNFSTYWNYPLAHQQLSVISTVPQNGGIQIDFYANDTATLKLNKKHYIVDPFHARDLGVSVGYFHKYAATGGYPQVLYATEQAEDYFCTITKLDGNVIQGEVRYKVLGVVFSGLFYSDKLTYKTGQ